MLSKQASAASLLVALAAIGVLDCQHAHGQVANPPRGAQLAGAPLAAKAAEYTGRVLTRPRSAQDWRRAGLDQQAAIARRAAALARVEPSIMRRFPEVDEVLLAVPAGMTDVQYVAALLATGDYQYVEPDWLVHAALVPNDPMYGLQWHLPKISAPAAWNLTTGSSSVIIAICDSGIDLDHPDLAGALVSGYNAVDQLPQSSGGQVDGLTNHGTQVAGSAAAIGNNATGVCGVGWNLRLMPVRVSNQPNDSATISDINAGARWAVDHGAKIINASFSGVHSASVQTTGEYIRNAGGIYVWAAGNASTSLGLSDPLDVVIVSGTDQNDAAATFTNYGRGIDIAAPAVAIQTTNLGGYGPINGTSFAAPIACGTFGLLWSLNPALSSKAVEAIVATTATDLGAPGEDDIFGSGRINAFAAAQLAATAATTPLAPIVRNDRAALLDVSPQVIDVLRNDVDLNGKAIDISSFPATTTTGAMLSLTTTGDPNAPHALSYQPPAAFEGIDSFTYSASDPTALSNSASVQVGVVHSIPFAPPVTITVANAFASPAELDAVDLDGDGDLDLAGTYIDTINTMRFFRNDGQGAFTHVGGVPLSSFSRVVADYGEFTSDTCRDIVFVEPLANRLCVSAGNCNLGFAAPIINTLASVNSIVAATAAGQALDFNSDGKRDIAVTQNGFPGAIRIMLGDGAGHFASSGSIQPIDSPGMLRAADMTGDGVPEIVCGGAGFGTITIMRIGPAGQILSSREFAAGGPVSDLALTDHDEDGDLDVITITSGAVGAIPAVRILRNNGAGVLSPVEVINATGDFTQAVVADDLDGDGDGDFATANLLSNNVSVFPGLPGGVTLGVSSLLGAPVGVHDVAGGDFDGDGDGDLAAMLITVLGNQRLMIFENLATPLAGPGDLNGDGVVDVNDLLIVITQWGACPAPPALCAGDANHDSVVDVNDLLIVITNWG